MTLASVWREKHNAKHPKRRKVQRWKWTDLCVCGHPRISHMELDTKTGATYATPCKCGCSEFRRAKRRTRRSRR